MKQNKTIDCQIVSAAETRSSENLRGIILPLFFGQAQILPGHAESFFLLKKGEIVFQQLSGTKEVSQISGGEGHIKDNVLVIIL